MAYLAHTANLQFVAFWAGGVGWILTAVTIGLIQWRVWIVADVTVVTSGVAWVGIWRACFYSHVLVTSEYEVMFCQRMGLSDPSTPPEVALAQVLMLVALLLGLWASAGVVYGLRNIYFGLDARQPIRLAFSVGGALYMLAGACSFVPLLWNLHSVAVNRTIAFPPNFHLPPAPVSQHVGAGIAVGIAASLLVVISGVVFLSYRFPAKMRTKVQPSWPGEGGHFDDSNIGTSLSLKSTLAANRDSAVTCQGMDNPAFHSQEDV